MPKAGITVAKGPQPKWPFSSLDRANDPVTAFLNSAVMQQVRNQPAPLSELGACTLLIEFANEGHLSASQWAEFMGPRADTSTTLKGQVDLVRSQLGELVKHREVASKKLGPWWADHMQRGVIAVPCAMFEDGALWMENQILARNIGAACAYAMCLLLDAKRDFGKKLCRCQAPGCGRFFFEYRSPGAKKATRLYCPDRPACKESAHRLQKAESKRNKRAEAKQRSRRR